MPGIHTTYSRPVVIRDTAQHSKDVADLMTLGFNATEDGLTVTPDWTDYKFTFGMENEDSVQNVAAFAHVKDESGDEPVEVMGDEYATWEELLLEMYSAMRGIAPMRPIADLETNTVIAMDQDKMREAFLESGVMESTNEEFRMDLMGLAQATFQMGPVERRVFYDYAFNEISVEEAWESEDRQFFTPEHDRYLLFMPDGYMLDIPLDDPMSVFEEFDESAFLGMMQRAMFGEDGFPPDSQEE